MVNLSLLRTGNDFMNGWSKFLHPLSAHICRRRKRLERGVHSLYLVWEGVIFTRHAIASSTLVYWKSKYAVENVDVLLRCCLGVMINLLLQLKHHKWHTSVTNNSILHVLPLHSAIFNYIYIAAMIDLTSVTYFPRMWCWLVRTHVATWPLTVAKLRAMRWRACKANALLLSLLITQSLIVQDKPLHAPFTGQLLIQRGPEHLVWRVT